MGWANSWPVPVQRRTGAADVARLRRARINGVRGVPADDHTAASSGFVRTFVGNGTL